MTAPPRNRTNPYQLAGVANAMFSLRVEETNLLKIGEQ